VARGSFASAELSEVAGARFAGCARLPDSDGPWSAARGAAQALLLPLGITGSAALMIGDGPVERMVCAAGRLADCLPADRYFR
jgi:hypothetical protein